MATPCKSCPSASRVFLCFGCSSCSSCSSSESSSSTPTIPTSKKSLSLRLLLLLVWSALDDSRFELVPFARLHPRPLMPTLPLDFRCSSFVRLPSVCVHGVGADDCDEGGLTEAASALFTPRAPTAACPPVRCASTFTSLTPTALATSLGRFPATQDFLPAGLAALLARLLVRVTSPANEASSRLRSGLLRSAPRASANRDVRP